MTKCSFCEPEARVQAGKVKVDKTVGNIATLRSELGVRSIANLNSYTTPNFKAYDCVTYLLYSSLSLLWNTVLTFQFSTSQKHNINECVVTTFLNRSPNRIY